MRYPESSFDGDMTNVVAHSVFRNGNPRDEDDGAVPGMLWGRYSIPPAQGEWPDWFEWVPVKDGELSEIDLESIVSWVMGLDIAEELPELFGDEEDLNREVIY